MKITKQVVIDLKEEEKEEAIQYLLTNFAGYSIDNIVYTPLSSTYDAYMVVTVEE